MVIEWVMFRDQLDAFQKAIGDWVASTFGQNWFISTEERTMRFMEEAIELAQALDFPPEKIKHLVDVKYAEPKGDVWQECGGVSVTFLALAQNQNISVAEELTKEVNRIHTPEVIEKARNKVRKKMSQGIFGSGLKLEVEGNGK